MDAELLQDTLKGFFLRDGQFYWDEASWHQSQLFGQQLDEQSRHLAALLLRAWLQGPDRTLREGVLYLASESISVPECGPELVDLIGEPQYSAFAMSALGRAQYHQAIPLLQKVFLGIRRPGPSFQRARAAAAALAELDVTAGTTCTVACIQVDVERGFTTDNLFSSECATIAPVSPLIRVHRQRGLHILLWHLRDRSDDVRDWALAGLVKHLKREREILERQEKTTALTSRITDIEDMVQVVKRELGRPGMPT